MGAIVYCQYEDVKEHGTSKPSWNSYQRTAYETFSRTGWAISLAWIVYACNYGYGGMVEVWSCHTQFSPNWRGWGPLGKLTFSVYLIHPLVIFIYLSNRRDLNYLEDFSVSYLYSAYLLLSYVGGGVLSVLFEWPSAGLEKLVFGKARKPASSK
ncbi:hypothetical protein EB796_013603 [Bugula neritina]|uniref:Nrf-6 n=1 Tax=Bugula neritina TaxID=10212 RepID=A0A7J7JP14_BUGNE|nr:hypothetical protein EB796_013603 [Bugula neritina]